MPEMFILTIEFTLEKLRLNIDMELPSMILIKDLRVKILNVIKNIYAGNFLDCNECTLIYANRFLGDNETLASAGAFDGSFIKINAI